MQELIAQLLRLYLPAGAPVPQGLEAHLEGRATHAFDLVRDGAVRAIVIPFERQRDADGAMQWERLCAVANALQGELGLPAPAVSISGAAGFRLWLSFERPMPIVQAQVLLDLVRTAYCPDMPPLTGIGAPIELPPCRNAATDKWAAFIHPGMGASFADEPALDMMPPLAAQVAFLQGLQPIDDEQLRHALDILQAAQPETVPAPAPRAAATEHAPVAPAGDVPAGLLLKDATLEDIVRHLHARNIEPTFRHVLPRD
ncbi:hypothetical protein [Pseudoduganella lutea]|uniref:Uncharacterized protein n=1 Tax=Pseudoduganella lutea TaxID=321985 RepID=A0A4P6L3H2_9BURK|nr:hypothetical protein [Pseudoduganella lutea]QBE65964.1 hypothetical protein EWM63_25715 [Pseudoduganella lutea]